MPLDLPDDKGTYVLWSRVGQARRMEVGRLGKFEIVPGYYAYVGSAHGGGGLRARLEYHLESIAAPHWHIDYLLQFALPLEVWHAVSDRRLEHEWAEMLERTPFLRQPIPRFGASDYHRSRTSHLFLSRKPPSFAWFAQRVRQLFEPDVVPGCCKLDTPAPGRANRRDASSLSS